MIVGQDISNFQGQINWPVYKDNTNFVFMKASEGVGYIDTWFGNNRKQARDFNLPRGFYHFARPDIGNLPESEAKFFCDLIDGDPIQEGEVLALDFEVTYHDPVGWSKSFLDYVSNHFNGIKPLIYLNQNLTTSFDWKPVVDADYGLWLASYTYDPNNNSGNTGAWPFMALQQWTDKQQVPGIQGNVDGDVFFGNADQFKSYGYHAIITQPIPQPPVPQPPPPTPEPPNPTPPPTPIPEPVPTPPPSPTVPEPVPPTPVPPVPPVPPQPQPTNFFARLWALIKALFGL